MEDFALTPPVSSPRKPRVAHNLADMTGQVFGRLTAVCKVGTRGKSALWSCRCSCGNEHFTTRAALKGGYSRSCGCLYVESRTRRKTKYTCYLPPGESARRRILKGYRRAALVRGLEWSLTPDLFFRLIEQPCHYCGSPPTRALKVSRNGDIVWNGVDRVDNAAGYTTANVVPCCHTCNHAKCDMLREEFLAWIDRLVQYRGKLKRSE
jgi:hypothetical protein